MNQIKISTLILFFLLPIFSIAQEVNLEKGIIAYYPLDGNAMDRSGQHNHGEIIGTVKASEDRNDRANQCMRFNGMDGYIHVPNTSSLSSPEEQISIGVWVYAYDFSNHRYGIICNKSDQQGVRPQFGMHFGYDKGCFMAADFNGGRGVFKTIPIALNRWYHMVMTVEGDQAIAYMDGKLVGQMTIKTNPFNKDLALDIGRSQTGNNPMFFSGQLDELVIYNRVLSAEEVKALYEKGIQQDLITEVETTTVEEEKVIPLPTAIKERAVEFTHTINVKQGDLELEIWDRKSQDGDRVTVLLNGEEVVLENYKLLNKKKNIAISLDGDTYLTLHAENLGITPPNTAAFSINDGHTTQTIELSSDMGKSETILIKLKN